MRTALKPILFRSSSRIDTWRRAVAANGGAPTSTDIDIIRTFYASFDVDSGDLVYWLSAPDKGTAFINLIRPGSNTLLEVGTGTFTAYRGWAGDGTTGYLNTRFPLYVSSKYAQDDAHMAVYIGTNVSASGQNDCGSNIAQINSRSGSFIRHKSNETTVNQGGSISTSVGQSAWVRSGGASYDVYRNGSLSHTQSFASAALTSGPIYLGASSASDGVTPVAFSIRQLSFFHLGRNTSMASAYSNVSTVLSAIGAPTS